MCSGRLEIIMTIATSVALVGAGLLSFAIAYMIFQGLWGE